jgi:hypothetical protein
MTDQPDAPFFDEDDEGKLQQELDSLYLENLDIMDAILLLEENLTEVDDAVGMYITLYDFHTELEKIEDAGQVLVEAAKRVSSSHHADLTFFLYNQLELFSQLNPDAQSAYERLGRIISDDEGDLGVNTTHVDQRKLYQMDLVPEILLSRHLYRMKIISDDEFHFALQDLCWCVNRPILAPRSVLYVLEDRGLPHREKSIEFIAEDSSTPYLDLHLIDFDPEVVATLPEEFYRRRAAAVFGEVGGEPLVALLNPYNLQLREDVAGMLDAQPHFFLASAEGYQHFLQKLESGFAT